MSSCWLVWCRCLFIVITVQCPRRDFLSCCHLANATRSDDSGGATTRPFGALLLNHCRPLCQVVLVCMASDQRNMSLPPNYSPARPEINGCCQNGPAPLRPRLPALVSSAGLDDVIDACARRRRVVCDV